MCAKTVCGVALVFLHIGVIVKPSLSNSNKTTPEFGLFVARAPHSAIFAPCQAEATFNPWYIGNAEISAVSVERPAIIISAFELIAFWICSAPARATIFEQLFIMSSLIFGAPFKGLIFPDLNFLSKKSLDMSVLS